MLKTLTVWNFALLEHVQADFGPGLNILTGETGAGKSILIDSLGAILGQRMTSDAIRTGCEWLRVEAVFALGKEQAGLGRFLASQAITVEDDDILIITRQVTRNGRNMILVNGSHVTLAVLKQLSGYLVDIHGQNENLALLKTDNQFRLLDGSSETVQKELAAYRAAYAQWGGLKKELALKQQSAMDIEQRIDMLHWQDKEITEAHLEIGEDDRLEADIRKLSHAEKISGYVDDAYQLLDGDSRNSLSVLAALSKVQKDLEALARFDEALGNSSKMVEEALTGVQEAAYEIRDYSEGLEFDPAYLDKLESRMDTIDKLRRKYGATVADVLEHQQKVQAELAAIENHDEDIACLEKKIAAAEADLVEVAAKLDEVRRQEAERLSDAVQEQLLALGMPKARFVIALTPAASFLPNGRNELQMMFSANPGEAVKPIQKIASGGELSRIALAVKTVEAERDASVPSMVFDEIDTGIGGRTAQMVAERVALVAAYKQVLCITHLPQIACMADEHLYISKAVADGKTSTSVKRLSEPERVNEIARMASGADVTAASLDNAREMIDNARIKKGNLKRR
jgi:DNA repair protein RecN (Recombination protein N)